jgi:branched-chain amino acid transport system permease protein
MFASIQGFVSPESFRVWDSITVLCMVVLGGMGHVAGVILGALLLWTLPELLRYTAVPVQEQLFGRVLLDPESLRMLLLGMALILVMLLRPAGLWPSPVRRRELAATPQPRA